MSTISGEPQLGLFGILHRVGVGYDKENEERPYLVEQANTLSGITLHIHRIVRLNLGRSDTPQEYRFFGRSNLSNQFTYIESELIGFNSYSAYDFQANALNLLLLSQSIEVNDDLRISLGYDYKRLEGRPGMASNAVKDISVEMDNALRRETLRDGERRSFRQYLITMTSNGRLRHFELRRGGEMTGNESSNIIESRAYGFISYFDPDTYWASSPKGVVGIGFAAMGSLLWPFFSFEFRLAFNDPELLARDSGFRSIFRVKVGLIINRLDFWR